MPLSSVVVGVCIAQLCVGSILEAMQRGVHQDVMAGVTAARAGVLGLLPAIAGESYTTAYPDLLKLHMLQEVEDACSLLRKVLRRFGSCFAVALRTQRVCVNNQHHHHHHHYHHHHHHPGLLHCMHQLVLHNVCNVLTLCERQGGWLCSTLLQHGFTVVVCKLPAQPIIQNMQQDWPPGQLLTLRFMVQPGSSDCAAPGAGTLRRGPAA
jgi:hypothetical protein